MDWMEVRVEVKGIYKKKKRKETKERLRISLAVLHHRPTFETLSSGVIRTNQFGRVNRYLIKLEFAWNFDWDKKEVYRMEGVGIIRDNLLPFIF